MKIFPAFIIFGIRGIKIKKDEGQFECPQCEVTRPYKFKKVIRFFTLYFIPLIPLGKIGEYVECQACRNTFIPRVLDHSSGSEKFMAEYEIAMRHVLTLMILADGIVDQNEKEVVVDIFNKSSHNDISMEELEAYIEQVKANPGNVNTYLRHVGSKLNGVGKEAIIRAAWAVADADGSIDPEEIKLMKEMSEAMDMTPSHLKGVLQELMDSHNHSFSEN